MQPKAKPGEYSLATGEAAVRRLSALHRIYSPAGRRILLQAGLKAGMKVADFGCGVGATTRTLAEMVGPTGTVTGIEMSEAQLEQGRKLCRAAGFTNATFVQASATSTNLPRVDVYHRHGPPAVVAATHLSSRIRHLAGSSPQRLNRRYRACKASGSP